MFLCVGNELFYRFLCCWQIIFRTSSQDDNYTENIFHLKVQDNCTSLETERNKEEIWQKYFEFWQFFLLSSSQQNRDAMFDSNKLEVNGEITLCYSEISNELTSFHNEFESLFQNIKSQTFKYFLELLWNKI